MDFDPQITTWTTEQLEESRNEALETIRGFIDVFGDKAGDLFLATLRDSLNTIETEILERSLNLSRES